MKPIILFLFIQLLVCSAIAQDLSILNKNAEPGKMYGKCRLKDKTRAVEDQVAKVLKFINTEWQVELDTIYRDTFEGENYQQVLIKEPSTKWGYDTKLSRNCLSANPLDCVVLYYLEVPANYKSIYFGEADSFKVVEVERVIRDPMIEVMYDDVVCVDLPVEEDRSRLVLLDEYQNILYVKMVAGLWSEWREVLCSGPGGRTYLLSQIKMKLRDEGFYKGPINDLMDNGLKAALMKFQKAKGLPGGQLDMETLKALGVSY